MTFFDRQFNEIRAFMDRKKALGQVKEISHTQKTIWPEGGSRNLVLEQEFRH